VSGVLHATQFDPPPAILSNPRSQQLGRTGVPQDRALRPPSLIPLLTDTPSAFASILRFASSSMDKYLQHASLVLAREAIPSQNVVINGGGRPGLVLKEAFVSSITLAMVAITVVSFCLARRLVGVSCYSGLPLARWCKRILIALFLFFLSLC